MTCLFLNKCLNVDDCWMTFLTTCRSPRRNISPVQAALVQMCFSSAQLTYITLSYMYIVLNLLDFIYIYVYKSFYLFIHAFIFYCILYMHIYVSFLNDFYYLVS